jgi:hypothetical protein
MIKFFKHLFKRLGLRIYIYYHRMFSRNRSNYTNNEIKSSAIFRKLVNHPGSTFLIAPLSLKRYIKNEKLGIFILLSDLRLNITNHIYNYDIDINEDLSKRLQSMFDKKVEAARMELETEMQSQIQHSLLKILDKLDNLD